MKNIPLWINGKAVESKSGRFGDVFDPAFGEVAGKVGFANQAEINQTIAAAAAAFPQWRDQSLTKRIQIMFKFR